MHTTNPHLAADLAAGITAERLDTLTARADPRGGWRFDLGGATYTAVLFLDDPSYARITTTGADHGPVDGMLYAGDNRDPDPDFEPLHRVTIAARHTPDTPLVCCDPDLAAALLAELPAPDRAALVLVENTYPSIRRAIAYGYRPSVLVAFVRSSRSLTDRDMISYLGWPADMVRVVTEAEIATLERARDAGIPVHSRRLAVDIGQLVDAHTERRVAEALTAD